MAQSFYHITFQASDGKIIEADVKAEYTPGDGFDNIEYQNVVIATTSGRTGGATLDRMPDEYVGEADFESEGKLPQESDARIEDNWDYDL
jgi:hypothetical protein